MRGLIVGIANEHSLATGCADAICDMGGSLALTYLDDKALPHVQPVADRLGAEFLLPLNVSDEGQMDAVFERIAQEWGGLDFLIHSIAFAPKADLHGRFMDCTGEGFGIAMDISCHSLVRLARRAVPLMRNGGSILTMSFYGSEKVVPGYGLMGPVKAALESTVRYLANDLGVYEIRVNELSTGPVKTRAASGLSHFDELMRTTAERAPLRSLVTVEQVGEMAAFLLSPKARFVTGQTIYVDAGFNTTA